jgi:hypothetical protein
MARAKTYYYVVDSLDTEKGEKIRSALREISAIQAIGIRVSAGVVEVQSTKDVETEVQMACTVVGCTFRTRVKKLK